MQLPLSASALVPVGVGAVLTGMLLILVVLAARRRVHGAGTPGAAGLAVTEGIEPQPNLAHVAEMEVAAPQTAADRAETPSVPESALGSPGDRMEDGTKGTGSTLRDTGASEPSDIPESNPAGPVAAAGPNGAQPSADPPCAAPFRLPPNRDETGSSRSVAAAVAQAFAVRAAASRAGVPLPTRGTNGAGPALRRQGPDGSRDEPQATALRRADDTSGGRDNGNPVGEQPPVPASDGAAVPPPEHGTEPELVTGANGSRTPRPRVRKRTRGSSVR